MAQVTGDDGTPSGFTPNGSFGVWGDSGVGGPFGPGGNGVVGSNSAGTGVAGFSLLEDPRAAGVYGQGPKVGVAGAIDGANTAPRTKVGVYGTGANGRGRLGGIGVQGESDVSSGVVGISHSGDGVSGSSSTGVGVRASSSNAPAVFAVSGQDVALLGLSNGIGVMGAGGVNAGFFFGNVRVTGAITKGGGGFEIDHPLAPGQRYLRHSFVESPEMKNLYDGIATCDAKGRAVVELPKWFEALNKDFRYQLTPIGKSAPGLFVAATVKGGRFTIGGGAPGLKVSWQVTGVRKDAWANANRLAVESDKVGPDRGRYLHPDVHGPKAKGRGISALREAEVKAQLARGRKKK
jgi:hypothetical protein